MSLNASTHPCHILQSLLLCQITTYLGISKSKLAAAHTKNLLPDTCDIGCIRHCRSAQHVGEVGDIIPCFNIKCYTPSRHLLSLTDAPQVVTVSCKSLPALPGAMILRSWGSLAVRALRSMPLMSAWTLPRITGFCICAT